MPAPTGDGSRAGIDGRGLGVSAGPLAGESGKGYDKLLAAGLGRAGGDVIEGTENGLRASGGREGLPAMKATVGVEAGGEGQFRFELMCSFVAYEFSVRARQGLMLLKSECLCASHEAASLR